MKSDFFFTTFLTENEHYIVEDMIRSKCKELNIPVLYYRKFKTGHVAMYRECKLGCSPKIGESIMKNLKIKFGNYHKSNNDNQAIFNEEKITKPLEAYKNFYERSLKY